MRHIIIILISLLFIGCAGNPLNVSPIQNFEKDRYLGTWYEIARLDHGFERGLSHVTAEYSQRTDGKIRVLNRGYKSEKGEYKEAEGRAKFKFDENTGHLKVSFFGPFYGDYIVFGLDKNAYQYAYISGGRDNYLWLLSRTPSVTNMVKHDFINMAKSLGYDTNALIWVDHSEPPQTH